MKDKVVALEALRGFAAVVVLVWHCVLAFIPQIAGGYKGAQKSAFQMHEGPWFALMNGRGAVIVFFVLSGFVLTQKYFATRERSVIAMSALRRWPRLFPLALASTLISFAFASISNDVALQAAAVSGSSWLKRAIFSGVPDFWDAVLQGTVFVFFRGAPDDHSYNSNLWTMWWEMMGSFIAFGTALWLGAGLPSLARWSGAVVILIGAILWSPNFAAFVVGVILSYAAVSRPFKIGPVGGLVLLVFGLALLSYTQSGWLSFLNSFGLAPYRFHVYIVGAACLVSAFYFCDSIRSFMSRRLFADLGRISFALYVVHLPVIGLLGSAAYLSSGSAAAITTVFLVSFLAAVPLTMLDEWWLDKLRSLTPFQQNRAAPLATGTA